MVLIGGPDDGVITPWESRYVSIDKNCLRRLYMFFLIYFSFSHFGYFDEKYNVVPLHNRDIYKKDAIGLKTLETQNKLILLTFPHVRHMEWHLNLTVIRETILPFLD